MIKHANYHHGILMFGKGEIDMRGERFKLAREATGLSLEDFASKFGISTQDVEAYEAEQKTVPSDVRSSIAKSLCIDEAYFNREVEAELGEISFLDGTTTNDSPYPYLSFAIRDQAETWTRLRGLFPNEPIPSYTCSLDLGKIGSDDIEEVAEQVRIEWELNDKPIKNMVECFEAHGILVSSLPEVRMRDVSDRAQTRLYQRNERGGTRTGMNQLDKKEVTQIVLNQLDDSVRGKAHGLVTSVGTTPMIVLLPDKNDIQRRFTLASALGYLILNGHLTQSMSVDKACKRFARAFLFPKLKVKELFASSHGASETNAAAVAKAGFEAHLTYGLPHEHVLQRCIDLGLIKDDDDIIDKKYREIRDYADGVDARLNKLANDMQIDTKSGLFRKLVIKATQKGDIYSSKAAELLNTSLFNLNMELAKG